MCTPALSLISRMLGLAMLALASWGFVQAQDAAPPWPDNPYCSALWDRVLTERGPGAEADSLAFMIPPLGHAGVVGGMAEVERRARHQRPGAEGTVFVAVIVGADGKPRCPRVAHPSSLGRAADAIAVVMGLPFAPEERDGRAVASPFSVPVRFGR